MNEKQLDKTLRDLLEDHEEWYETIGYRREQLDLSEAILCGANLCKANLHEADLRGVDLDRANLKDVKIKRSQLDTMIIEEDTTTEDNSDVQPKELLK